MHEFLRRDVLMVAWIGAEVPKLNRPGTVVTVWNRDKVRRFRRAGSGLQNMTNRYRRFAGNWRFKIGGLPILVGYRVGYSGAGTGQNRS